MKKRLEKILLRFDMKILNSRKPQTIDVKE